MGRESMPAASGRTSTATSTKIQRRVPDANRRPRGLLDTSVVIDLDIVADDSLPIESSISVLTLAELAAGPHATDDPLERARRQESIQRAEARLDALPFDADTARSYGRVYAAVAAAGRKPRGARTVDLLIAATALAYGLPLFTRNPRDFESLEDLIEVVRVP